MNTTRKDTWAKASLEASESTQGRRRWQLILRATLATVKLAGLKTYTKCHNLKRLTQELELITSMMWLVLLFAANVEKFENWTNYTNFKMVEQINTNVGGDDFEDIIDGNWNKSVTNDF
jgi:hypothetical protein